MKKAGAARLLALPSRKRLDGSAAVNEDNAVVVVVVVVVVGAVVVVVAVGVAAPVRLCLLRVCRWRRVGRPPPPPHDTDFRAPIFSS